MKKILTLALSLAAISTVSAQDVMLTLHPDKAETVIPKEIYGQFAEHLGRCIYGGIWVGKDSEIPNIEGYRKDVFEALKDLQVPVMRWPGGCFADEYHWRDGIGPQEGRRKMVNTNWGGTVEDNSFGTHEFLNLCEMLGCEPYISGNVGSGTVQEMAEWVEYMNSDTNSTIAEERRKNGREKPWNVKYFGVGNESWGCGGNMKIEYYTNLYRRYNTYARNYGDNRLFRIASGANGGDTHWMDVAMRECRHNMDGISVHFYAVRDWGSEDDPITGIPMGKKGSALVFSDQEYYEIVSKSLEIEDIIRAHIAVMDKYDPKKNVAIMFDEWGTWFNVEPGTNPGWLYQQSTMRDAIVAASTLNIFHKYTDRVKMANIAQVVNVLQSMILTNEKNPSDPCVLTPTYHVFKMYNAHKEGKFVPADLVCNHIQVNDKEQVPVVSSSASLKDGVITLSLANMDLNQKHTVSVSIDGKQVASAEGQVITSADIHDYNDFGRRESVYPHVFTDSKIGKKDGKLTVTLPAHSVVTLTVKTK
ncbi:MAG: alpha-N-arabinofuranosidase [Bacteroidales bacterium]|nr:alpha-N-arabinofuranosidase [Candidatus Liminaster caballi]